MNLKNKIKNYLELLFSIFGFVPKHATLVRAVAILSALVLSYYLIYFQPANSTLAIIYFVLAEILYIGFIYAVLPENGLRHWFIKKFGEERGYLIVEGILGFIFFNNGASIAYVASSTPSNLFQFIPKEILFVIAAVLFVVGFAVKLFAAKATSVDIYYWKDMFLGRKICEFVVSGPYKYLKNPMYGIGQLQAYATAIWYGSVFGLIVAMVNQGLVFSFYYLEEKKFIKRVYSKA